MGPLMPVEAIPASATLMPLVVFKRCLLPGGAGLVCADLPGALRASHTPSLRHLHGKVDVDLLPAVICPKFAVGRSWHGCCLLADVAVRKPERRQPSISGRSRERGPPLVVKAVSTFRIPPPPVATRITTGFPFQNDGDMAFLETDFVYRAEDTRTRVDASLDASPDQIPDDVMLARIESRCCSQGVEVVEKLAFLGRTQIVGIPARHARRRPRRQIGNNDVGRGYASPLRFVDNHIRPFELRRRLTGRKKIMGNLSPPSASQMGRDLQPTLVQSTCCFFAPASTAASRVSCAR